jgi:signal transduction histidine kinase
MSYSTSSGFEASFDVAVPRLALHIHESPNGVTAAQIANVMPAEAIEMVCHELRNSLAVIRGAARLLRAPTTTVGANNARSLIERHVGQMSRHIEDLLTQRRDDGNHGLQLSRIDLREIARFATDAVGPEMTRRGHHLTVNLPDEPAWAHADASRLEQVFANLLINSAKYTPDGGDIAFTIERLNGSVFVRVRDSGVGIEPAMLSRVFGMFVQVDAALPRADGGRGIGLAVVRDLVELHGGTVKATSAGLGLGSEFTVVLPAL